MNERTEQRSNAQTMNNRMKVPLCCSISLAGTGILSQGPYLGSRKQHGPW
jgi:hypothetical protein